MIFPSKFFVTGTDTGVGKTLVAAVLTLGLQARYWKPIQSGLHEGTDTQWIQRNTGLPDDRFLSETFRLSQPLSPHAASEMDGIEINLSDFQMPAEALSQRLIVEGAGGLMVPINSECLMVDLIAHLELPALVVARSGLGTINHTVLTIHELRRRAIPILGVVMNGEINQSNRRAIEHYADVSVIAQIGPLPDLSPRVLMNVFDRSFTRTPEASLR